MGTSTSFGQMISAAQQRSDLVNSSFITDSEWRAMMNASLQQLQEKLIEAYGSQYSVQTPYAFTTDGTSDAYALPADFFKLLGVDLQLSPYGQSSALGWVTIWRFNFADRNRYTLPNLVTIWGRTNLSYALRGNSLWLQPMPQGGQTLRLWYAPVFTPLVNDSDTFDGVNGWEEWVINDVAKKALVKEESDTSGVDGLQAVQNDRLRTIIDSRDIGAPSTTVDVYAASGWPWGC